MLSNDTSPFSRLARLVGSLFISALTFRVFLAEHEASLRYIFQIRFG